SGRRALDLGCGIGLAGLAAARRGAAVEFADVEADALAFARFNARDLPPERLCFTQIDWFAATATGPFDLLFLADVAYEERHFEPLRRHLRQALAPAGCALLTDPYRRATDHFLAWLRPEFLVEEQVVDTSFDGVRVALRLAILRPASGAKAAPGEA